MKWGDKLSMLVLYKFKYKNKSVLGNVSENFR